MVIKTAVWELYAMMKPYMLMPQDLVEDFAKATENDVDFNNKDYINAEINDVKENVQNNVASEELNVDFDSFDEETGVINEKPKFTKIDSDLYD